jgi:transcriptional antiterminator NusG
VVHAYSGFEKSVQRALEDRINRAGMTDKFGKISCRWRRSSR